LGIENISGGEEMRLLKGIFWTFGGSFLMASCASTQINYNTLEIASTYDQLIIKQVTYNIMKSFEDPYGLPAFVKVTAQTTTAQNSITPTVTSPLSAQITQLAQLTQAATAQTVSSVTTQRAGAGLSIAATDQWNSTYTLTPVTDSDQLRRLRSLYQYVTGALSPPPDNSDPEYNADHEFEALYPLIETGTSSASTPSPNETTVTLTAGKLVVKQGSSPSKEKTKYVRRSYKPLADGTYNHFNGYTWVLVDPDKTFIRQPGCILCDLGKKLSDKERIDACTDNKRQLDQKCYENYKDAHKLEKTDELRNDWLYGPKDQLGPDAVALPSNGISTIYLKKNANGQPDGGRRYFYEFVLFTEDASSQGTGSPASGGQSQGRKTPNVQRVSIPVGGALPSP
jgi:hypothetical protein